MAALYVTLCKLAASISFHHKLFFEVFSYLVLKSLLSLNSDSKIAPPLHLLTPDKKASNCSIKK